MSFKIDFATATPLVLQIITIRSLIQFVLRQNAATSTICVCYSKAQFVRHLQEEDARMTDDQEETTESYPATRWSVPTLRLLALAHTVKLVFCSDITQLRAYLATYELPNAQQLKNSNPGLQSNEPWPLLVLYGPIQLHRPTSAFSAQGLNRTFAAAVEAAHRSRSKLLVCEDSLRSGTDPPTAQSIHMLPEDDLQSTVANIWETEVALLNVATKAFGVGEPGWVGRTVKIRAIVGRWCHFRTLRESCEM